MAKSGKYISQSEKIQKRVKLVGTANTSYLYGTGLAYNRDYGTATEGDGSRDNRVEPLTTANHKDFAGVLDHNVTLDSTGASWVTINEPGSVCDVALGSDTTLNATILSCVASSGGTGRFRSDRGLVGRGAAKALETNASGNIGESLDGTATVNATAVADTGLFASAVAGDKLVILSSATDAGAAGATPGVYTIATVTDDNNAVLSSSASSGASEIMCYVISGNPTALCKLLTGDESSGCIEWLAPLVNAAAQSMVGGYTHVQGAVTLGAGASTATLANGILVGEKKGYYCHGTLTTNGYVVTVATGDKFDGSTAITTVTYDADAEETLYEWRGSTWRMTANAGATIA